MKVLVPIKRVVDFNVKIRVKADGSGVDLANVNEIERTWGGGNRKPGDQVLIRLKAS